MCANTCRLFETFSFNCASETSAVAQMACVPRFLMESKLRAYKDVYLVESGAPHRLDRSPFDDAVYKHVRSQLGQLGSDRGTHVTVVFTDVTCEGMRDYMRASSNQEKDCIASLDGRRESFKHFSERVGVSQGNLYRDYLYVDAEAGISVKGQVTRALEASERTWSLMGGEGRGEPLAAADRGEPRLATASHFADQLDTLRKKLSEPPEALFEAPRRRRLVNQI